MSALFRRSFSPFIRRLSSAEVQTSDELLTQSSNKRRQKFIPQLVVNNRVRQQNTYAQIESVPLDSFSEINPFELAKNEVRQILREILKMFSGDSELGHLSTYYFCGLGKHVRPTKVVLLAKAINAHLGRRTEISKMQMETAKIAELIHCTSLVHDDVVDLAEERRGKPSVNIVFGERKATLGGTYIVGNIIQLIARLRSNDVVTSMLQVLYDIVDGEMMQMDKLSSSQEAYEHYIERIYKKTASLMAYPCKTVSMQAGGDKEMQEAAFDFGRNFGMAFQLIDDTFDCKEDLEFGMATAPVLLAAKAHPEITEMMKRRFEIPGDVETTISLIDKSDAIENTRSLAVQHSWEAVNILSTLKDSPEKYALIELVHKVLKRNNNISN